MEGSCESIENLSNQCKNSLPIKISFFKTKGDIISISISGNNVGIFGFSAPTTKGRWLSHTSTRVIILPIVNIQIFFSSILALWNFFFYAPCLPLFFFFFCFKLWHYWTPSVPCRLCFLSPPLFPSPPPRFSTSYPCSLNKRKSFGTFHHKAECRLCSRLIKNKKIEIKKETEREGGRCIVRINRGQ